MVKFWIYDVSVLANNNHILEIWPYQYLSMERKFNSISRLIIYLTILGYFFSRQLNILVAGVITLMVFIILYTVQKQNKKEGFSVLSVSIDNQKSLSQVRSYVRVNNYSFDVFLDPNMQVFKKMNGNLMPTNILLDQKGNIIWRHYGYLPGDEKNMNLQIRSALNLNS